MPKGTYIHKGDTLDYINSSEADIAYGDVVVIGSRVGIAGENIAVDATGSLKVVGVFELPAVNDTAFAVGDALYWDATAGKLTKTAEGNTAAGYATEAKAQTGTTARVKIG
jgi:predicted RecA/RadA family phage recombinase